MLIIILSPILAYFIDYIRTKLFIPKTATFIFIVLMTIPTLLVWVTGYNYSKSVFLWSAEMLIVMSAFLSLFTLIDNRIALKAAITALATLTILPLAFLGEMGASFGGGSREVINKSEFKNYIALQLEPQLYEKEKTLRIKKTQLFGLIEKTIFETWYLDTLPSSNCKYFIEDNITMLVYDVCKQQFTAD